MTNKANINVIIGSIIGVVLIYFQLLLPWTTIGLVIIIGLLTIFSIKDLSNRQIMELGDSLYYLGFILTLMALFVSFYKIGFEKELQNKEMNEAMAWLFGILGAGISTTITGLLMRELIYMKRKQYEEMEIEQITTEDIKNVVEKMSIALKVGQEAVVISKTARNVADKYTKSFESYRINLENLEKYFQDVKETMLVPMNNMESTIKNIENGLKNQIKHSQRSVNSLESINENMVEFDKNLGTAASELVLMKEALAEANLRYSSLKKSLDLDYNHLKIIAQNLPSDKIWKPLRYLSDSLPGIRDNINLAAIRLERTSKELLSTSEIFKLTLNGINNLTKNFNMIQSKISRTSQINNGVIGKFERTMNELNNLISKLSLELKKKPRPNQTLIPVKPTSHLPGKKRSLFNKIFRR